jgi:hypothetical protein
MLNHVLKEVWMIKRGEGGANLERRRREMFFQNLEREVEWENEYFGTKLAYILPCASLLKCPSSQSCLPDTDTQVHI